MSAYACVCVFVCLSVCAFTCVRVGVCLGEFERVFECRVSMCAREILCECLCARVFVCERLCIFVFVCVSM